MSRRTTSEDGWSRQSTNTIRNRGSPTSAEPRGTGTFTNSMSSGEEEREEVIGGSGSDRGSVGDYSLACMTSYLWNCVMKTRQEVHLLHVHSSLSVKTRCPDPDLGSLSRRAKLSRMPLKQPCRWATSFSIVSACFCQAAFLRYSLLYWVAILSHSIWFASKKATIGKLVFSSLGSGLCSMHAMPTLGLHDFLPTQSV